MDGAVEEKMQDDEIGCECKNKKKRVGEKDVCV